LAQAEEYTMNKDQFEEKAREYTTKYARSTKNESPAKQPKSQGNTSKRDLGTNECPGAKNLKRSTSPD